MESTEMNTGYSKLNTQTSVAPACQVQEYLVPPNTNSPFLSRLREVGETPILDDSLNHGVKN